MTKIIQYIITIILLLITMLSNGQTYNETISNAYSAAYIENDYQKASKYFDKAFEENKAKSADLYYAAEVNLKLDSIAKFRRLLTDAIFCGYANYDFLEKQAQYKAHFESSIWMKLISKSKENYKVFKKDFRRLKKIIPNRYKTHRRVSSSIDLRQDSLTVKYQGHRNTCSVFAATALVEYLIWEKEKQYVDLSEAYNYWVSKKYALSNSYLKEIYTSIDGLAGYLALEGYKHGSMTEENWKYENTNWLNNKDERCKKTNGNYNMECFTGTPPENSTKATYIADPVFIERESIGQYILQEKKPVLMNIFWYFKAVNNETGVFRMPTEEDIDKGGHVILLVGYDSETKSFIYQNSWGMKWGDKGYGTISEDYIMHHYEMTEAFPYGIDASEDEKILAIKASMGVSAKLKNNQ